MRLGELVDETPPPKPAKPPQRPRPRSDDEDDWGDPTVLS
jgi:hypothetical protein